MQPVKAKRKALGLILIFLAIIFTFAVIRHQDKKRQNTTAAHEQELEQIHSLGYDQGYVSAVIDTYMGDPQYMLTEEGGGDLKLWKRTTIDPEHAKNLQQKKHE